MDWLEEDGRALSSQGRFLTGEDRLRVLVADESKLAAEALMFMLDSDPRLEAIGYGLSGWEALELAAAYEPDVILVGPRVSELDPLELTRLVHELFPDVLVVLVCERLVPVRVEEAYALGAADCVPASQSADELLHAISAARTRQLAFNRGRRQAERRTLRLVRPGDVDG